MTGIIFFCCVRLLLILYLEDSYNLLNLPTFVLTYLLYGRLNHMIWVLRCCEFFFSGPISRILTFASDLLLLVLPGMLG